MWEQEKHHLKEFEKLIPKYRVRPTILLPLWNIAGLVSLFVVLLLAKFDYFACLP
jgi:ubiquinone biosynthesis monooxygenase Coq7